MKVAVLCLLTVAFAGCGASAEERQPETEELRSSARHLLEASFVAVWRDPVANAETRLQYNSKERLRIESNGIDQLTVDGKLYALDPDTKMYDVVLNGEGFSDDVTAFVRRLTDATVTEVEDAGWRYQSKEREDRITGTVVVSNGVINRISVDDGGRSSVYSIQSVGAAPLVESPLPNKVVTSAAPQRCPEDGSNPTTVSFCIE